jgi:uroporphyrinogen-III synthase
MGEGQSREEIEDNVPDKTWKYAVIVTSVTGQTAFFGMKDGYDEALTLQKNAFAVGWKTARIYDPFLKEVTERPEEQSSPPSK